MRPNRFLTAVSGIAVVAAGGAVVVPLVVPSTMAFLGAVVSSALVALVFAGYNVHSVVTYQEPRMAAGFVATVLGLWFVAAPLTYGAGTAATAATQLAGLVLATTAGYATLDAIERGFRDIPAAADSALDSGYESTTADD